MNGSLPALWHLPWKPTIPHYLPPRLVKRTSSVHRCRRPRPPQVDALQEPFGSGKSFSRTMEATDGGTNERARAAAAEARKRFQVSSLKENQIEDVN